MKKMKFMKLVDTKLITAEKSVLIGIDNPGGVHIVNRILVVQPENRTFTQEELNLIEELISKL